MFGSHFLPHVLYWLILAQNCWRGVFGWSQYEQPLRLPPTNGNSLLEFDLSIGHLLTMSTSKHDELFIHEYLPQNMAWLERDKNQLKGCLANSTILQLPSNGKGGVKARNSQLGQWVKETERALPRLVQFHGRHQRLWAVNGQTPGPTLVMPEGAEVRLRLRNRLLLDSLSVHLHGILLHGQWYHGGVAQLQQCPVPVLSDFTIRFRAHPPGTHWYHGQFPDGHQSNGFLGALVVLPKEGIKEVRDFVAILQDWPLKRSEEVEEKWRDGIEKAEKDDADGIWSILVNQKGWHNRTDITKSPASIPWSRFPVGKDEQIRLRLVHGGYRHPLAVHIEGHRMEVVATDGNEVEPMEKVDAVVIYPGERLDIRVHTLVKPTRRLYRMVVSPAEQLFSDAPEKPIYGLAELEYGNGAEKMVKNGVDFQLAKCANGKGPCAVVGCPFQVKSNNGEDVFTTGDGRVFKCILVEQLNSLEPSETNRNGTTTENIDEKHIISIDPVQRTVDGFHFQMPNSTTSSMPFFLAPTEALRANNCSECLENPCQCFYHKRFAIGRNVQITFVHKMMPNVAANVTSNSLGDLFRQSFAIHLHGIKFKVIKIGRPLVDTTSNGNLRVEANPDLAKCIRDKQCQQFADDGNSDRRQVLKDTVLVPFGGYTVISFHAENPGWWLAETQQNGRGSVRFAFAIGRDEEMPKVPKGFPTDCGTFEPGIGIYENFV